MSAEEDTFAGRRAIGCTTGGLSSRKVANSISTAPQGTAVTTTHATYLLTASTDGTPRISWRQAYDRGQAC